MEETAFHTFDTPPVTVALARNMDDGIGRYGTIYALYNNNWEFVGHLEFPFEAEETGQLLNPFSNWDNTEPMDVVCFPAFGDVPIGDINVVVTTAPITQEAVVQIGTLQANRRMTINRDNEAWYMRMHWVYAMSHLYVALHGYYGLVEPTLMGYLYPTYAGAHEGIRVAPSPFAPALNQLNYILPGFVIVDHVLHHNLPDRGINTFTQAQADFWRVDVAAEYAQYVQIMYERGAETLCKQEFLRIVTPFWEAEAIVRRRTERLVRSSAVLSDVITLAVNGMVIRPSADGMYYNVHFILSDAMIATGRGLGRFAAAVSDNEVVMFLSSEVSYLFKQNGLHMMGGTLTVHTFTPFNMLALAQVIGRNIATANILQDMILSSLYSNFGIVLDYLTDEQMYGFLAGIVVGILNNFMFGIGDIDSFDRIYADNHFYWFGRMVVDTFAFVLFSAGADMAANAAAAAWASIPLQAKVALASTKPSGTMSLPIGGITISTTAATAVAFATAGAASFLLAARSLQNLTESAEGLAQAEGTGDSNNGNNNNQDKPRWSVIEGEFQEFDSFDAFKRKKGAAGDGMHWHHIVEKNQVEKSGFTQQQVNNTNNIIALDSTTHGKVSGHFNSYVEGTTTRVRDWLAGQSLDVQFEYGVNILRSFGVVIP